MRKMRRLPGTRAGCVCESKLVDYSLAETQGSRRIPHTFLRLSAATYSAAALSVFSAFKLRAAAGPAQLQLPESPSVVV